MSWRSIQCAIYVNEYEPPYQTGQCVNPKSTDELFQVYNGKVNISQMFVFLWCHV